MKCLDNTTENLAEAVHILKNGGVIAHPADTCFGLAADLMNPESLKRLQEIKGRDKGKPMSIMFPSYMKPLLGEYVQCNDFAHFVCDKLLPGPVTIVLPKGHKVPDYFFPEVDTVGIRIPYDPPTDKLLLKFQGPIITTSANLSNEPACSNCEEVFKIFENSEYQPDLILRGPIKGVCMPSTVIKLEYDKVQILRKGPIGKEQLESLLGMDVM